MEFEGYINIPVEDLLFGSNTLFRPNALPWSNALLVPRAIVNQVVRRNEVDLGTITLGGNTGVGATAGGEFSFISNQDGDNVSVDGIGLAIRGGVGITKGGSIAWSRENNRHDDESGE